MVDNKIKNRINNYIKQGKSLLAETNSTLDSIQKAKTTPKMLIDIFEVATQSRIEKKRLWSNLGTIWASNPHYQNLESLNREYQEWYNQIIDFVKTISIDKRTLNQAGNSQVLINKFNRPKNMKALDKKIKYTIIPLESIKEMKLLYNENIPNILVKRKVKRKLEKKSKYYITAKPILSQLRNYPEVKEAIKGAIERLEHNGSDYTRQCLGSCRNALETLVKQMSGQNEWTEGLSKLIPSRTNQNVVKGAYSYLCKYGPHSLKIPTHIESDNGFNLTMSAIAIILQE